MGDRSKIEWTDATWNPIVGCSPVSDGCLNCYAASMASRFCKKGEYYDGAVVPLTIPLGDGLWTGRTYRKHPKFNPLTARKPRTIFVCSMGDLFHESVPDEWIDEVMAVIAMADKHRFMVLTKRPERMKAYFSDYRRAANIVALDNWPLSNLACGVSIENQATADERISVLLQTPAAYRFVSYEPALGPVDFEQYLQPRECVLCETNECDLSGDSECRAVGNEPSAKIDLVIMGGESGPNARPMHPDWARSVRDQCEAAGVPFHFKQWGAWHKEPIGFSEKRRAELKHLLWVSPDGNFSSAIGQGEMQCDSLLMYRAGKKKAGRLLDGWEHNGSISWGQP